MMFKKLEEVFDMVVILMLIPAMWYQLKLNNIPLALTFAIVLRLYLDVYIRKEKS